MAKYDPTKLDDLGARRQDLLAQLQDVNTQITAEVPKALKGGLIQAEIARRLQMTRESVVQATKPASERWKRGARGRPAE